MRVFRHLFGHGDKEDLPGLLPAIERAVLAVEPLLKQIGSYPDSYRKPVAVALQYARDLAANLPGPVMINRESYVMDAFVHALFPSVDTVREALCSSAALRDYQRDYTASDEFYALMGMRRFEKSMMGMELSGQTVQRDVVQNVVYFTSHTLEHPAPSEQQTRDKVSWGFFDSLVDKVKKRVELRKQARQSQQLEKDMLMAHLQTADARARPALEKELARMIDKMQLASGTFELGNYKEDFEAVLQNPELYLRLVQTPIVLDSMGIRRNRGDASRAAEIIFNDLIGFDRRDWTVALVHCNNLQRESFAERLDQAYRKLTI
jgi:hypothetical protein